MSGLGFNQRPSGNGLGAAAHAAEHAALSSDVPASRSLTLADDQRVLDCTSASAIALTIESDATSGWTGKHTLTYFQGGAGAVTFAAGSGVTLSGTIPINGIGTMNAVRRTGANAWRYVS